MSNIVDDLCVPRCYNGIMKDYRERPLRGHPCRGFSIGGNMGYRKVGYAEQVWYIIKYRLRELFHRKK